LKDYLLDLAENLHEQLSGRSLTFSPNSPLHLDGLDDPGTFGELHLHLYRYADHGHVPHLR
jgi:hypothetical protein